MSWADYGQFKREWHDWMAQNRTWRSYQLKPAIPPNMLASEVLGTYVTDPNQPLRGVEFSRTEIMGRWFVGVTVFDTAGRWTPEDCLAATWNELDAIVATLDSTVNRSRRQKAVRR